MVNYLAITPARDEEHLLPQLISSMVRQSCLPARWLIVDDGSTDATSAIIDRAASEHPWIEACHLERNRPRAEGGESVIRQFLPRDVTKQYSHILRLDADLSFAPDFVELLVREFVRNAKLGIAGATLYEPIDGHWREIVTPRFHTRGAVKMYSAECFDAIGGLDPGLGWDTVDEATALMLGFATRSFRHIHARHHRPQAAAGGLWRGRAASGLAAYRAGYSPLFMIVRALRHFRSKPFMLGGLLMLGGFCQGYLYRIPRAASGDLIKFIRRQQRRRLLMMDSVWR